jgi:hypothetical protein
MEYEYTFLGSTHMEPPAGSHACGEEAAGEPSLPRALPTAGGAACRRGMGESKGRGAHLELFFAVAKYMSLLDTWHCYYYNTAGLPRIAQGGWLHISLSSSSRMSMGGGCGKLLTVFIWDNKKIGEKKLIRDLLLTAPPAHRMRDAWLVHGWPSLARPRRAGRQAPGSRQAPADMMMGIQRLPQRSGGGR